MNKDDRCYGLDHQERLDAEPEDVVEGLLGAAVERPDEPFDATADRMTWPLKVHVFRRVSLIRHIPLLALNAVEGMLERLDEDYAGEDAAATKPTEAMKAAAVALAQAVVAEYVPWACEPTGEVIEYTREQAKALWEETA